MSPHFHDADGNLKRVNALQHMSMFALFIIHGVADLLTHLEVKFIPPGSDYFTAVVAYCALGFGFIIHTVNKTPLERIIHL